MAVIQPKKVIHTLYIIMVLIVNALNKNTALNTMASDHSILICHFTSFVYTKICSPSTMYIYIEK